MYNTIEEIIEVNKENGYHFFDTDTMQWWDTDIAPEVFDGEYFVTNDSNGFGGRAYSIRRARDNGSIDTILTSFDDMAPIREWLSERGFI